jgi:amidophosphoribosyltransferase
LLSVHSVTPPLEGFADKVSRLNVFANALHELGKPRINKDDIFTALRDVYAKCIGAFACTAMVTGFGIIGFRYTA